VQAYPIGIDFKAYRAAIKVGAVSTYLARVRRRINRKKVILSVSRLDYTKGIIEQLRAVERVLADSNPKKLLYRLIVAPSREVIDEYRELKLEIDRTVDEINSRFMQSHGVAPIDFEYRSHGFEELNAWYRAVDILLVTPLIDGMNLVVKEYVAARGNYRGIVVLSKTAGAAAQLHSAIQVDPSNISDIRCGITDALEMPLHERKRRWQALRNNVKQEDIFWWSERFLRDLAGTTVRQVPRIRRRRPKLLP
jgi:trehalose 6-phosphate synthase/phosphatase